MVPRFGALSDVIHADLSQLLGLEVHVNVGASRQRRDGPFTNGHMSFLTLTSRAGASPDQYLDAREYNDARLIGSILLRASVLVALVSIIF